MLCKINAHPLHGQMYPAMADRDLACITSRALDVILGLRGVGDLQGGAAKVEGPCRALLTARAVVWV